MVAVLDEAANVCRWSELPNLYSHYGSRGIALLTFLQSWSQGVDAWGREGMRKLWSAANVKVYGGGVSEVEFLNELSRLIGDHDRRDTSVTYNSRGTGTAGGGGGRSTSHQYRPERILDVADLAALDRGRVVVFAAGSVPVLGQTRPWWQGPGRDRGVDRRPRPRRRPDHTAQPSSPGSDGPVSAVSSPDECAEKWADGETTDGASSGAADGTLSPETSPETGPGTGEPPALHYATVDEFVREFLVHVLWVDVSAHARIWCPEWWRHPAAIVRLEALHRSFEQLRLDPAQGMSVWLRDHADVHMAVLTDPLKGCSVTKGHDDHRDQVIPATPAPEGLFEHDD